MEDRIETLVTNQLYEFTMKVLGGEGSNLPAGARGAFVPCYSPAPDYQSAVRKGVAAIAEMHFVFEDLPGNVRELPIASWNDYVAAIWPEFVDNLPTQDEVAVLVQKGTVFFGPFATFG